MKSTHSANIFNILFGAIVVMSLLGFQATPLWAQQPQEKEVLTAGCKTAYFLINDLIDGYKIKTNMKILAKRTGNRVATKLLVAGDIEFAFTCQPHEKLAKMNKLESQQVKDWRTVRIAKDPIVVVINRQNKVTNLTKAQLSDIFSGKITNWQDVGENDMAVKLAIQSDSIQSGAQVVFREQTVGRINGKLQELSPHAIPSPGPKKRGAYVSQNPGAITFMGLSAYRERYGKLIQINNAAPTTENIINGSYPIAATYYIIYDIKNKAKVEPFVHYISGEDGLSAINKNFVADIDTDTAF